MASLNICESQNSHCKRRVSITAAAFRLIVFRLTVFRITVFCITVFRITVFRITAFQPGTHGDTLVCMLLH